MRTSIIKNRLRQDKPARFVCMYNPTLMMPLHAAKAGFDGIWLDTEHNTWDRREVQHMIARHHLANIDCIVRTGSRTATDLYHWLEDGASAIMSPLVNTGDDARTLAQAVKFPPIGERGLDGAGLDNEYYIDGTSKYPPVANEETLLIVQIETPAALRNIDDIAGVKGVDGLFIGHGDLAMRLGCPLDWSHPQMLESQEIVRDAAKRHGIAWGRPTVSVRDMASVAEKGGRLIAYGSDFGAVMQALPAYAKVFKEALGE